MVAATTNEVSLDGGLKIIHFEKDGEAIRH